MSGEYIAFLFLSLVSVAGGTLMLISQKVMHMMVAVIFAFLGIAGIFVLLSAEFIAAIQVMIYSGAVAIIMIFGIMLTNQHGKSKSNVSIIKRVMVGIAVILFAVSMYTGITQLKIPVTDVALHENNAEKIGIAIFSNYIIPFEIASIVLLVALIGAIIIAKNEKLEGGEK